MNGISATLVIVAGVLCVSDWLAVWRGNKTLEYVSKPGATVAFLAAALALSDVNGAPRAWLVAALVLCVFGDVFLMLPRDAFVPGLASFAVAQVLFAVSFALQDVTTLRIVIALAIVTPLIWWLSRRFIGSMRQKGMHQLVPAVVLYMTVISAMFIGALSGGTAIGIVGAVFFLASDSLIAEERFVVSRAWQSVTIMLTYHVALAGLVLGLL